MTVMSWLSRTSNDVRLAAALLVFEVVLALTVMDEGGRPSPLGWVLLVAAAVLLVWRRRRPMLVLIAVLACVGPYHAMDYTHAAPIPASMIALYTVAAAGPRWRSVVVALVSTGIVGVVMIGIDKHQGLEMLRTSGWVVAVMASGEAARLHRNYVAEIVDRAERAERTREDEAARKVAEERLRIARDLHDLLAHSITLIGVQASVAAHVLVDGRDPAGGRDPADGCGPADDRGSLDRAAIAGSFETIADACRDARSELRATLAVLRQGEPEPKDELPGLAGIGSLADAVRGTGLKVALDATGDSGRQVPPAVGAAAHRIVQEALTNVVKHAEASAARVEIEERADALLITVRDDGRGCCTEAGPGYRNGHGHGNGNGYASGAGAGDAHREEGYGILGMTERARSVGGTLHAAPHADGGFEVSAVLPLGRNAGD